MTLAPPEVDDPALAVPGTPNAVGVLRIAERIVAADAAALALLGAAEHELLGRRLEDVSVRLLSLSGECESDARSLALRARAAREGTAQSFVWECCATPGHRVCCLAELRRAPDGYEVLELRLRQVLLTPASPIMSVDLSANARRIFDQAQELIYLRDVAGRFTFANRAFLRRLGLGAADLLGRTEAEVFDARAGVDYRSWSNDAATLRSAAAQEFEEALSVRGRTRTLLSIKFPVFAVSGDIGSIISVGIDITKRKLMESALQNVALSITSVQGENVLRELARYVCDSLGVDFALIGRVRGGVVETLAAFDRGASVENFAYELAGTPCETVVGREFRILPDHLLLHYPGDTLLRRFGYRSYAGIPLFDSAGEAIGILAVLHRRPMREPQFVASLLKIYSVRAAAELERLRADAALREAEASYRAIFEAAEDPIFVHDCDTGEIVDVNRRACEVYGRTREQMLRTTVGDNSAGEPPYSGDDALRWIERASREGAVQFEWHRRGPDGSLRWDEVRLKRALIGGKPRVLAFTRDITERKLAEDALRASEEQYRSIFCASTDGLLLFRRDGRAIDVNPAFAAIVGCPVEEVLHSPAGSFVAPESSENLQKLMATVVTGERFEAEGLVVHRDGHRIPVNVRGVPVLYRGDAHHLAIVRDITAQRVAQAERERLEAQLRQAQKMEAIGHLAGGVAHDFNNLLTSLTGYVAMASERLEAIGETRAGRYLHKSLQSAERARNLIQQLLVFSRGQRGEPVAVQLERHLGEFVELLRSTLPSSVEFHTGYEQGLPAVMVDPTQLDQVLMNLCINARDAMEGQGVMRVTVGRRSFRAAVCASCQAEVSGEFVELAVSDTGQGIAPAVLGRVFDPFFTTKSPGKGSGMGLSTTHGIVHDCGGHILVDSAVDRGSTFRVLLPGVNDAGAAARASPPACAPATASPRLSGSVLLVDDDAHVLEFMEELLGQWGLRVRGFNDPQAALASVSSGDVSCDCAILDQTMPGMSGLELARRLRQFIPAPRIVLYTGYSNQISDAELSRIGVLELLHKPLDHGRLLRLLSDTLAR